MAKATKSPTECGAALKALQMPDVRGVGVAQYGCHAESRSKGPHALSRFLRRRRAGRRPPGGRGRLPGRPPRRAGRHRAARRTSSCAAPSPADAAVLSRLAQLDGAPRPAGAVLVAELDGEIVAAVPFDGGRAIADPFRPTAELVELLRARCAKAAPVRPAAAPAPAPAPAHRRLRGPHPRVRAPTHAHSHRRSHAIHSDLVIHFASARAFRTSYSPSGNSHDQQPPDRAHGGARRARGRAARRGGWEAVPGLRRG